MGKSTTERDNGESPFRGLLLEAGIPRMPRSVDDDKPINRRHQRLRLKRATTPRLDRTWSLS